MREREAQQTSLDADRKPTARAWGAHLFLAVCEMCVFRYKQHSSRDKPLGPCPRNPHPPQSLHPPCLLNCVCVCMCSCLRWTGVCGPCTAALAGATEKTVVCLREREKHKEERAEGQQACQSRPSLLEWVPPSLLLSVSSSHSCFISSSVILVSSYHHSPHLCLSTTVILLMSLLQCCVFFAKSRVSFFLMYYTFATNASCLYPFTSDSNGPMLSLVIKPFLIFSSLCLNYVNTCVLVFILLFIHLFCLLCNVLVLHQ